MNRHRILRLSLSLLCTAALLLPVGPRPAAAQATPSETVLAAAGTYRAYRAAHTDAPQPAGQAAYPAERAALGGAGALDTPAAIDALCAVLPADGYAEWIIDVAVTGSYPLLLEYATIPGNGLDYEYAVTVDGAAPFAEAARLFLPRIWDYAYPEGARFDTDNRGNEISPHRTEERTLARQGIAEHTGMDDSDFLFYLTAGRHTIRVTCLRETMALSRLLVGGDPSPAAYQDRLRAWEEAHGAPREGRGLVFTEAEMPCRSNTSAILPGYDRSTPATSPNSASQILLNVIGGASWVNSGDWLEWNFTVPEEGYYSLSFKYRQNIVRGLSTSRRVRIDDAVPFREWEAAAFPYSDSWRIETLASPEGDPYLVYLTAGEHRLCLEAVLGDIAGTLQAVEDCVQELNAYYREILMVTGASPDPLRDYYLDKEIDGLTAAFARVSRTLKDEAKQLEARSMKGNETSLFYVMADQLDSFLKDPSTISKRLDRYKSNIGALSELLFTLKKQPLELDGFYISAPGRDLPAADCSIWAKIGFRAAYFLNSFWQDYSQVGNAYGATEDPLDVWVSVSDMLSTGTASGREQAQLLARMVSDEFLPQQGIPVNLSLVNTSEALMQAIISGNGPHVALFVPKTVPVNLGIRGALADLSTMPDSTQIQDRFSPAALVGFRAGEALYALPDTMTFYMLYYRRDIFTELGLDPPDDWKAFYEVTARLNKQNLQVGIPENQMIFEMLLLQNGEALYNADQTATALTTPGALDAFRQWTDLYVQYSLPLSFDFLNRFRTGEMPMGLAPLTMYNQLSAAAPELHNLWDMRPVPASSSGSRAESLGTTGAIVVASSGRTADGFAFLDWWTAEETQRAFGHQLEVLLGSSSRYNTANLGAFASLPWSAAEQAALQVQQKALWDMPVTPASYYITRNITNAFRRVTYYYENPSEVMNRYSADMDKEIERKNREFGIQGKGSGT